MRTYHIKDKSQSLSIRAMSFDLDTLYNRMEIRVSIPFDQGNVFRQNVTFYPSYFFLCLNPFRSGQCLSTHKNLNLFSVRGSQSLSIRAMSFDGCIMSNSTNLQGLNPFRSGQCLSTAAVCWRQESCGLSDPLPNFWGRLRSWLLI